jgi:hypothetical protein
VTDLIPILQTAIGPVILISGVGLLLLTMTNRLGRAIDRARQLDSALPNADPLAHGALEAQLRILFGRARLIRTAIVLASMSALAAAVLVILLFLAALLDIASPWLISSLFVTCMVCLILSLVLFIHDINRSLAALRLELQTRGMGDL